MLAIFLVFFSLLNVVLLGVFSSPSVAQVIQRGVRFLFTCLVAYFLWRGARWARWVTIVLAALAAITSFVGFVALPADVHPFFRAWVLVLGAFYLVVALLLLFSRAIRAHFAHRHDYAVQQSSSHDNAS